MDTDYTFLIYIHAPHRLVSPGRTRVGLSLDQTCSNITLISATDIPKSLGVRFGMDWGGWGNAKNSQPATKKPFRYVHSELRSANKHRMTQGRDQNPVADESFRNTTTRRSSIYESTPSWIPVMSWHTTSICPENCQDLHRRWYRANKA